MQEYNANAVAKALGELNRPQLIPNHILPIRLCGSFYRSYLRLFWWRQALGRSPEPGFTQSGLAYLSPKPCLLPLIYIAQGSYISPENSRVEYPMWLDYNVTINNYTSYHVS